MIRKKQDFFLPLSSIFSAPRGKKRESELKNNLARRTRRRTKEDQEKEEEEEEEGGLEGLEFIFKLDS